MHITRLVRRGDHVLKSLSVKDLRLIENFNINLIEATPETLRTGTEHNHRTIRELNLLLTICRTHGANERGDLPTSAYSPQRRKRLSGSPQMVSGPNNLQTRKQDTKNHDHRQDKVGLPNLPRD
jgi:hypothetical protein